MSVTSMENSQVGITEALQLILFSDCHIQISFLIYKKKNI